MTKLWEISEGMRRVAADIEASEGELTEEIEAKIELLNMDWEHKVEACCHVMDEIQSRHDVLKAHVDRLASAMKSLKRSKESLKDYVHRQHELAGKKKTITSTYVVTLQNNSMPSVLVSQFDQLPDDYRKIKESADTKKIRASIEAGEVVPGAHLEYGTHIRMRLGAAGKEE
tara:strand:+ start:553 stop:1068 length:516 start_codon:yes stop_codon:yes gene_type:complete